MPPQIKTRFSNLLTVMGEVLQLHLSHDAPPAVTIRLRSGDTVEAHLLPTSEIDTLKNLDLASRGREDFKSAGEEPGTPPVDLATYQSRLSQLGFNESEAKRLWELRGRLENWVDTKQPPQLLLIEGNYYLDGEQSRYDVRKLTILSTFHPTNPTDDRRYLFEHTAWWLEQITRMADQWLDSLFGEKRTYLRDDFAALYRTNLNIYGLPTDDGSQEVATLSRLIYGLSSAYLLTGQERYLRAAQAGVDYQREAFRLTSADGRYCFWAHAKRKLRYGSRKILPSEAGDDFGAIALYEQIYALAGLTHYYRITYDPQVFHDIRRTILAFNELFRRREFPATMLTPRSGPDPGNRDELLIDDTPGYYSHLDPVTFSPHDPSLGKNQSRKNWNSIGDHIPAYLIDLILALDPLPSDAPSELLELVQQLKAMLKELSETIVANLVDRRGTNPYVIERLKLATGAIAAGERRATPTEMDRYLDPDLQWDWQQNRAVVGHNLKIAWNLSRVAFFERTEAKRARERGDTQLADIKLQWTQRLEEAAIKLGDEMASLGIDQVRGGCFDTVEREPRNGMWIQFPWHGTKDFWQQEQAILAYYILYGLTKVNSDRQQREFTPPRSDIYLKLARESSAFWNAFFLDRERSGIFFRVNADGQPIIEGAYGQKGNHSVSGYHAFELNFLAQIYQRSFLPHKKLRFSSFVMNFQVHRRSPLKAINVLPDFMPPDRLRVSRIVIDGLERPLDRCIAAEFPFQIRLQENDFEVPIQITLQQTE
jgi:mannose/cellobiose epimerase-like protein (N-acyl-D-glucosamine 2-epimerase family)